MSLFTSGERRGTIALAAIMAIVVITLAVTAGMHRNSPAPQPAADSAGVSVTVHAESKAEADSTLTRQHRTNRKKNAAGTKADTRGRTRSYLDERVD